jgi:hypothetical protein
MRLLLRCLAAAVTAMAIAGGLAPSTSAQGQAPARSEEYTIKVMPPGGPPPRLANGKPDFSGHWLPNGAGQGISGRFGVDPAARGQFDPKVTPEERPMFQPWALARIKAMTPTELELSKSSVNCLPRGTAAIWLQNPYSTVIMHSPDKMAQLYEVLNNWRLIHTDGRPIPKDPEPLFWGNSTTRWEGDTLVVESTGYDDRVYIQPNGWFHSDALKVTERYSRPSMNYLMVEILVEDPKVLVKPWKSAPRRWTLGNGEVYEFYCTNNHELTELEKLRAQELAEAAKKK